MGMPNTNSGGSAKLASKLSLAKTGPLRRTGFLLPNRHTNDVTNGGAEKFL
jgi:hypothetical protein